MLAKFRKCNDDLENVKENSAAAFGFAKVFTFAKLSSVVFLTMTKVGFSMTIKSHNCILPGFAKCDLCDVVIDFANYYSDAKIATKARTTTTAVQKFLSNSKEIS